MGPEHRARSASCAQQPLLFRLRRPFDTGSALGRRLLMLRMIPSPWPRVADQEIGIQTLSVSSGRSAAPRSLFLTCSLILCFDSSCIVVSRFQPQGGATLKSLTHREDSVG